MPISADTILEVEDIHTYYGASHVLQGVGLAVGAGQCVGILGRNGAGKSTTLRSIMGLTPARRGRVRFAGRDITADSTFRIVQRGIAFVPEDRGIFASVTVEDHLAIARWAARGRRRPTTESVFSLFPRLAERRHALGGHLSGGEQQMLAIGRALVTAPDLLILDEPSEGLAPVIVERLAEVLQEIKASGTPILLVEQNYALAMALVDHVYVLSQGTVAFSGTAEALQANETVRATYLSV